MKNLYKEVNTILNSISFGELWEGFTKIPFALYNKNNVYFEAETIPYDNRFSSNTIITYNDVRTAIFYIENPTLEDPRLLAANLIKEMFCGFLGNKNNKAVLNDLLILDYPDSLENYQIKFQENQLLVDSIKSKNTNFKKSLLNEFFSMRKHREELIGNFINYEYQLETLEGLPEFISMKALKSISVELYEEKVTTYLKKISTIKKYFFNLRRISLYIGALLFIALEDAEVTLSSSLNLNEKNCYELITENICTNLIPKNIETNLDFITMYNNTVKKKKKALSDFCNNKVSEIIGSYYISDYNSADMIKVGDYILCNSFISLSHKITKEKLILKGPVVIKLAPNSMDEVISYYA